MSLAERRGGNRSVITDTILREAEMSTAPEPAGGTLALVGETGSGKTTLGSLVARLYDPSRGTVRIDGTDVRDLRLADLAAIVGVVSQETYLPHTTVRENLRHAKPGATDAEIQDAARAAQIHDLIASLPDGRSTPWPEAAPPSPSRTACPPSATQTRSSCWTTAGLSRPATTPACSPTRAATPNWPPRPSMRRRSLGWLSVARSR
jgi:ABC transporter family protein